MIIEYRKEDPSIAINPLHKMTVKEVQAEVEPVGYKLVEVLDFLPSQHIFNLPRCRPTRFLTSARRFPEGCGSPRSSPRANAMNRGSSRL